MDRKTVPSVFEIAHQLKRRRVVLWFAVVLILLPTLFTHFFFWRIEHRLNLKIHRKPLVTLFPGTIHLSGPFLEWQNRFYVRSGELVVHFPFWSIFQNEVLISLDGRDLVVEAGPALLRSFGHDRITFDHVAAKLVVRSKDIDIDFLHAESKLIQFHLKKPSRSKKIQAV